MDAKSGIVHTTWRAYFVCKDEVEHGEEGVMKLKSHFSSFYSDISNFFARENSNCAKIPWVNCNTVQTFLLLLWDWVQKTRKCNSSLIRYYRASAVQRGISSEKVPLIWQFLPWPALHLQPLKISILRCNVATAQATALESNIQFESFWIATKRTLEWCECANYEAWCVHEFEVWQLWQSIIWPPPFEWDDVSERIQGSNNAHNL